MKFVKRLLKAEHYLVKTEQAILTVLIIIIITLSFSQVVMRLFFSKGILWADPLLRYLTMWIGFFGAALSAYYGKHFALDISEKVFKGKTKKIVNIISSLFTSGTLLLLTIAAAQFFNMEVEAQSKLFSIGNFRVPSYSMEFILPLGFALILIHTLLSPLRHGKNKDGI